MGERQPKFRLFRHLQRDHRDPSSYGPLRPRDLHGPDIEGPAAKYTPVIVDFIPFVGTATNAIRIGPILYHVGRGFKQGDELRMDRRAKHLKTDSKSTELTKKREFLEKYLLDRFDRVNRLAKETYHGQKLTRAVRRTVISALGIGAAIAANRLMPGYEEFANGLVSNVIRDIFIVSTIAESGIALREWDERRRIKGRAGKVEGGEYTDKEFKAQIKRAVDLIEMPGNRATEVEKLYAVLDPIRHKKWKAFDALPQSAKDAIEDNARRIETIDNLSKNVIRPSAVVSRIIRRKGIRTLLEDRRQIRAEADYVYVPPEHRLSDSPNGKYVRASALTA